VSDHTRAIIVAAGRGRRLGPETDEIPKCMVPVAGRPILHRQIEALTAAGVREFVIVRGYLGDRIAPPSGPVAGVRVGVRFVDNPDWATNNILGSLMFAEAEMDDGFVFSYSDIVFATEHGRRLAAAEVGSGIALVIDRLWGDTYVGRIHHPIAEAELASVRPPPPPQLPPGAEGGLAPAEPAAPAVTVDRVGKTVVAPQAAVGEFIGLARFSRAGAAALRREWHRALAAPGGLEARYGRAAHLRQAYLSDALNALADGGEALTALFVDGRWREIDTEEDLGRAHALVDDWDRAPRTPPRASPLTSARATPSSDEDG
jgi:CTP:molybdopterin cytidylyltransferase MocA